MEKTAAKELRTQELSAARQPHPPWVPPYVASTSEKNKTQPTHQEKAKILTGARCGIQKQELAIRE